MNRRSFFGFAVGGAVAAPAALLIGERPTTEYIHGEILPLEPIAPSPITIEVIKAEVQSAVALAMRQAEEVRQRRAFSHHARKSGIDVHFLTPSNARG
ncbi:hypothetical protein [Sinorhizobium medicae]|uniref:hypothetical protein n=1 Tax=Sinorhizobium medicae TaxID=110321 RepID=UPI000C7E4BFB|nr:hypothetical protein [Sinorhizobium medicae]PLU56777.1 hypothetical protein BMJ23_12560 [Sinorhizobium medicae]PLU75178.1 hypothetical protein BMJ21_01905 [Sinorhizobium medicae]PLU83955.1 hypothetical protein BMJ22_00715 [Sinorhizobium medicae]